MTRDSQQLLLLLFCCRHSPVNRVPHLCLVNRKVVRDRRGRRVVALVASDSIRILAGRANRLHRGIGEVQVLWQTRLPDVAVLGGVLRLVVHVDVREASGVHDCRHGRVVTSTGQVLVALHRAKGTASVGRDADLLSSKGLGGLSKSQIHGIVPLLSWIDISAHVEVVLKRQLSALDGCGQVALVELGRVVQQTVHLETG